VAPHQLLTDVKIPAKHQPGRPGEVRHSRAAIDRAQECLGYEPVVDFETACDSPSRSTPDRAVRRGRA